MFIEVGSKITFESVFYKFYLYYTLKKNMVNLKPPLIQNSDPAKGDRKVTEQLPFRNH